MSRTTCNSASNRCSTDVLPTVFPELFLNAATMLTKQVWTNEGLQMIADDVGYHREAAVRARFAWRRSLWSGREGLEGALRGSAVGWVLPEKPHVAVWRSAEKVQEIVGWRRLQLLRQSVYRGSSA